MTGPSTPAIAAIEAAGIPFDVVRTERAQSAEESAELQGIPSSRPCCARSSCVAARTTTCSSSCPAVGGSTGRRSAPTSGVKRLSLPDADEAREATGYERGTITPFGCDPRLAGHRRRLRDRALERSPSAAARIGVNLHLAPADLVAALDAESPT